MSHRSLPSDQDRPLGDQHAQSSPTGCGTVLKERRKKMAKEVGSGGVAKEDKERSTDKDDCEACWV